MVGEEVGGFEEQFVLSIDVLPVSAEDDLVSFELKQGARC